MNDVDKLLNNLEPIIDKRCQEIKKEKINNILVLIIFLVFTILPSVLFLLNIKIIYFMIIVVIILLSIFLIKLPDILRKDLEVYHEYIYRKN